MPITPYSDVDELLAGLLLQVEEVLDSNLVGLYLYGSLVYGDFDYDISDIDLVAVTYSNLDEGEFRRLDKMQNDFVAQNGRWKDRIEIAYLAQAALKTFRLHKSPLAIISPGEPFHIIEAGDEWLMNWYMVREIGLTLFGPEPKALIDPISKEEFIRAVQQHARGWQSWIYEMRAQKAQAYAILTLCRALYTLRNGEQVSKRKAAYWAMAELPAWASLIDAALLWRKTVAEEEFKVNPEATFVETEQFVQLVSRQIIEL